MDPPPQVWEHLVNLSVEYLVIFAFILLKIRRNVKLKNRQYVDFLFTLSEAKWYN